MIPKTGEVFLRSQGVRWVVTNVDLFGVAYEVEGLGVSGCVTWHQWRRLALARVEVGAMS